MRSGGKSRTPGTCFGGGDDIPDFVRLVYSWRRASGGRAVEDIRMILPREFEGKLFNGSNEPCDMLEGPCSCGAWHKVSEWEARLVRAGIVV